VTLRQLLAAQSLNGQVWFVCANVLVVFAAGEGRPMM
jgi:hypothetical protein